MVPATYAHAGRNASFFRKPLKKLSFRSSHGAAIVAGRETMTDARLQMEPRAPIFARFAI
jgi:hypothetical protein